MRITSGKVWARPSLATNIATCSQSHHQQLRSWGMFTDSFFDNLLSQSTDSAAKSLSRLLFRYSQASVGFVDAPSLAIISAMRCPGYVIDDVICSIPPE